MTAFLEPLPGLLDDPLLHLPDLPPRTDVRIPPLRDPFPSRALTVLAPLEPNAPGEKQIQSSVKLGSSKNASKPQRTTPKITPADVISARDTKKPNLAISALLESSSTNQLPRLLPPSFVNLAAVENKSSFQTWLPEYPPSKRVKVDQEYHGEYVHLPKPRQKEASKRVPLLPTIVNGIHEPPPSAALLPPMELEEVKAMLASISEPLSLPPEKMLNPPEPDHHDVINEDEFKLSNCAEEVDRVKNLTVSATNKPPRTWKKWSDDEIGQLLKGVAKHGAGKWKEICADPQLKFRDRKPMDLKDRFRVCFPSGSKEKSENGPNTTVESRSTSTLKRSRSSSATKELFIQTNTISSVSQDPLSDNHTPTNHFKIDIVPYKLTESSAELATAAKSRANQRVRKLWTEEEHRNLVKGFAKHGYQWTAIRNDTELNLSHRKATDIRDKFRSLFPQQYMDADSGPPVGRKQSTASTSSKSSSSIPPAAASSHHSRTSSNSIIISDRLKTVTTVPLASAMSSTKPSQPFTRPTDDSHRETTTTSIDILEITTQEPSTAPSLTLPPLALGDNDWDWGDNKLAPLLDWEEFGL
jgi:Myb-like DNA-binding domain